MALKCEKDGKISLKMNLGIYLTKEIENDLRKCEILTDGNVILTYRDQTKIVAKCKHGENLRLYTTKKGKRLWGCKFYSKTRRADVEYCRPCIIPHNHGKLGAHGVFINDENIDSLSDSVDVLDWHVREEVVKTFTKIEITTTQTKTKI